MSKNSTAPAVFKPNGSITCFTVDDLGAQFDTIAQATDSAIIVDLANVPYIDSYGLGWLMHTHTLRKKTGQGLIFTGLAGFVKDLFSDCSLDQVFTIRE